MAKRVTGQTKNLAMAIKKKLDGQPQPKTSTIEEYFNCRQKKYYKKGLPFIYHKEK